MGRSFVRGVSGASLWMLVGAVSVAHAQGQDVRYVGRAVSMVSPDGSTVDEVLAGGVTLDDPCGTTQNETCPIGEPHCFEVSCGGSMTVGGAFDENGVPRPGFPRVESRAEGAQNVLLGILSIAAGSTRAVADAESGALVTECSCDQVLLGLIPLAACPDGEGVPFPVTLLTGEFTIHPCRKETTIEDGLTVVSIASAVVEDSEGNETVIGLSRAGIEMPFTSGGGGCSVDGARRAPEAAALVVALGALWMAARRRRRFRRR